VDMRSESVATNDFGVFESLPCEFRAKKCGRFSSSRGFALPEKSPEKGKTSP